LEQYIPNWLEVTDFRRFGRYDNSTAALFGVLGEAVFWVANPKAKYCGIEFGTYDFEIDGNQYEVKTSYSSFSPRPDHHGLVNKRKLGHVERFAFARVHSNMKLGWVCGWIESDRFFQLATLRKTGETALPLSRNLVYHEDCYELALSKLNRFDRIDNDAVEAGKI